MINEDRKKLYDALSSEYDLGTYEEFEHNIGDSVKRRKLYDAASADYDLGDFESYSQRIGPTHKESLDAFTAEHGSWLNDFEARDSAETKKMVASSRSGLYMPSENAISGEERKRYMELHKQEEALKKAWFTSDEYLAQKDADALFLSNVQKDLSRQRVEYAQANPSIKQEGLFQINPYAVRGVEADTELERFATASRLMDDAIKMHNAPSRYDDKNVFLKFGKGAGDVLSDADFWTAGLTEIADNLGVRDVLSTVQEKLGNLNDLSEEAIENILSPAEKAVLQAWAINTQEQLKRKDDLSRAYQAGQGATESLGFMAEFALTGGIGKAATEGVEQMVKWLGKKALTKVGGMTDDVAAKVLKETGEKIAQSTVGKYGVGLAESLAEAAGRTGVMPSTFRNISEKATEIETDENGNNYLVKMNDAFAKGYVDSFIENLSEGGRVNALGTLFGDVAGKIPAYKKMVDKFSHTKASELWDAFNSSGVMNTLRAGGWHGLGEEYLEEWYGNALRTLTGVDKEALKDFATVDNQIVTLTSFLPMTIFGGTVSTAQVLSVNKDLEKKAAALKSALMERGYDEAQANNMIDMMRGAAPAEVSETLTPIVNSVANRNTNEAAALMKPVGEFAAAVQRWQSFNTKYNYQEQEQRDGLRAQMEENLGQFWQQDENGRQTVQRGVNEKGEVVYMLGKPSVEDVEAGVTSEVAAVTSDGRKVFVNPSEYQLEDELEMNTFLGNEIMAEKGNQEQARMIEEKEAKIAAIRETAVPGTAVNIGTAEAPMQAIVLQRNPDGVIVNTPDGQTRQMTYEEFGNYVGVNAVPMTDAQIDEHEADVLTADRAQREAALDQEYENEDAALEELSEAEDEIEQAVDTNTPLPMKADGSVDQTALWNNDPERWAQWNDEQRQDGGANTLAYVNGAIAKEQAKIAELQAAYAAESDFDARDAIEKEIADTQARVERLGAIRRGYIATAEAAPVVEAEPAAPRRAQQMREQEIEELNSRNERRLRVTSDEEDRAKIIESYLDKISEGSVPIVYLTVDNYEEVMKKNGCGPRTIASVKYAVDHGKRVGGFMSNDRVFIMTANISSIEEARVTYVHERQHVFTRSSDIVERILATGVKYEELQEWVRKFAKDDFYDSFGPEVLADELVSFAMEKAYTYEDFSVALQELGVDESIISIIKSINDEQQFSESLSQARRRERLHPHAVGNYQRGSSAYEGNTNEISSGLLGQQDDGTARDGYGRARFGEEGEGAEVISEEQLNAPNSGTAQQITAADGEVLADTDGKGGVRFSIRTWNEGGRDYLAAWLANDTTLTEEEKADILARMDEFYKNALLYSDTYVPFGTWSDAGVRYDNNGNPLMSVIKANGDYAMNLDFSLVCKKRRPLNRLLRTLVNRNAFATYTLRERELAEINWILQEHGFEVACALCFVDSKRYRVTGVADVFAALYNRLVKSLAPEGVQIAHFNYNENPNVEVVENGLDTMLDDQLNWDRFDRMLSAYKPGSVEHKVAQYLREHPEARKLVDATDFIEAEGFESVKENNPDLLKLYNMKKGTGGPKASFGDVQYLNDILKKEKSFDAEKAYAVGGVRLQSFSDFVPHMYFDYMQLFAELAAKKLPVHAYTKETLFAKIFGLTGAKINLSLVPAVVEGGVAPGLDAEGNYAWADPVTDAEGNVIQQGQSFPYDEAMAIQQAEGYSKNCGVIAVGISDAHIEKMLDDPNIPFIIPYHKSSLNAIVARMTNIDQYKDYTNVQNTRKASGSKLDKGTKDFNFNEYLHGLGESGTPQQAAQAYLDWCRENNYKPKFSQFAYHPNYYKLLQDFNTIDLATGEYAPQGAVTMTFPTEESAFGNVETLIQQGLQEDAELEEKMEQEIDGIADQVLARLEEISKEPKMSEKQQAKKMAELADERTAKIKAKAQGPIDLIAEAQKAVEEQVMFRFVGEQAAINLDKAQQSYALMNNLEVAREMVQQDVDARKIKAATGWERGADGKWRLERPDFEFRAKPSKKKTFKLSELISDDTLFAEYPQLKDMKVRYKKLPSGLAGQVGEEKGERMIFISEEQYRAYNPVYAKAVEEFTEKHPEVARLINSGQAARLTAEERKAFMDEMGPVLAVENPYLEEMGGRDTLAHEIQHLIQEYEGFAEGGSADMLDTTNQETAKRVQELRRILGIEIDLINDMVKDLNDMIRRGRAFQSAGDMANAIAVKTAFDRKKREYDAHMGNINYLKKELRKFNTLGLEGYKKLAGEVEARNVEKRLNMTEAERRESIYSDTQDVATEDQIFLRGNLMTTYNAESPRFRVTAEQDKAYMDAVKAGDMETAQRMVLEAAKLAMPNTKVVDENGNPKVVYHQTNAKVYINRETGQNWDDLNWKEKMEWDERDDWEDYWEERNFNTFSRVNARTTNELDGFFFAPEYDENHEYGDRTIPAFLNITNPASREDYNIDSSKNNAGREERIRLQNEGYDGVIREEDGQIWEYVAFEPSQIKSAEPVTYDNDGNVIPLSERFNEEKSDIRFRTSNNNQAIFVSNAAKAVEGIKQEKATPEQWLKMIEKNGGLKAGEDKWMGLSDFLKASDKKTLTKQEVLDFINENMIVIEEQHYSNEGVRAEADRILNERYPGWEDAFSFDWDPFMEEPHSDIYDEVKAARLYNETHEDQVETDEDGDIINDADYDKVEEFGAELAGIWYGRGRENTVREINGIREDYTTRGLTNLHEIALTVPTIESWNESDEVHFGDAGDGRAVAWIRFGETALTEVVKKDYQPKNEIEQQIKDYIEWCMKDGESLDDCIGYAYNQMDADPEGTLGWTDEAVASVAKGMRGENTTRVLVIDEIQSKRHQEGREKGYRVSNIEQWLSDNNVEVVESGEFYEFIKNGETDRRFSKGLMNYDIEKAKRLYVSGYNKSDIPDAPFDKNWHELAMKRMLRYAAENGYDVVAWTTGDQQADRYDLSRDVKKISASKPTKDGERIVNIYYRDEYNDFKNLVVDKEGKVVQGDYTGNALADVIGKEMALQIMNAEESTEFKGEGLKIGGEGMRGFYDKMLPAFMNKYGKKWGVKVEDIDLPNLGKSGRTMHSVPVTEEMKASVMEGQVMFRAIPITQEVQDEMDAISATAIVRGNYLKAPNGADTNLTPEQWAMVRTKAFKAWFGDWMLPYVSVRKVAVSKNHPFDLTKKAQETKKEAVSFAEQKGIIKTLSNEETNGKGDIIISRTAIEKVVDDAYKAKNRADLMLGAIASLPELIRESKLGEEHFSYAKGADNVRRPENGINEKESIFRYYGAIASEGDTYRVKITVKRDNGNRSQRAYTYEVMKIELTSGKTDAKEEALPTLANSITFANLLDGAENDKKNGEKLLDFSKVVDENGEPKVVYHGSPNKFNTFDEDMIGENTDSGFYGRGFYFATTEEESRGYGEYVIPAFLSMQNPLDLNELYAISDKWDGATAEGAVRWWYGLASMFPNDAISETVYASIGGEDWTIMDLKNRIDELAETSETPFADAAEEFGIDEDFFDMMGEEDVNLPDELTDALKANGYDGVINAGVENNELVALYPNQIKSATGNSGEFSTEDKDIRFRTKSDVNTNPTEAQKKAGNYKMGHIRLDGYNITIENPKGSVRRGTDSKGNAWENTLNNDYGYIRGTEGVDGDHIDVYLSDNPTEGNVFVIDQVNPETREFDEHKVLYGFNSAEEAREAYLANFSEGWNGLGTITEVSKDEFKKWIESSHRKTKPFSEYKSVRANEMQTTDESGLRYRVVTNQETLDRLNSEPTIKVYRAMQLIDGKLYPPMSAKVDGELRQPIELGQWEEAEERPDLVDEKGRFKLDKGNKSSLKARYNPYFHTSPTPLNDQFSSAQARPELVTVEVEVPESELTSGYKAEKAKDSVGKMEWKAGVVQSKLSGTRTVILSRWDKPVRIVPDSEVADVIVDMFEGRDITMPSNVVTPSLRAELEKRGVPFVETDNQGNPVEEVSFRVTGTPTDEVVTNGLQLTPAQTAEVAANIFAALPEESRKKITEGLNGDILGLKDAILQIPTSLASKENWNEEDKQMADVVAEEMTKMAGEMTRPFSAEEGLWLLYNNLNKGTDLISQASRALVQRNLGFDAETLAKQEQAKEDVRFRTVGDASSNAQASLYNRGAVNVWTRLKESFVDMQASVEELVKAIEKRTGKVAQGFENILLALNQQSSKGLAAMESYTQKFLKPMFDEIRKIMDETKMKYEDVVRYVILKHGLERNKKLAQRDARAHYQEIYDDIISKIIGMTAAQKRTYLTNAQLKEGDAKAELATLQAVDMSTMTDEEKREHKKKLAAARKAVEEAEEHLKRAQKIASLSEQEAQDELDKIFEKIENGTDSVFKEMRENDYSGISSMFYDQLGVDRKNFSTEEQYQAALMEAKKDRYSSLKDIEAAAEAEVKSFEGKTDTKELWKRINAATKETLRQQYEANTISKDQYLNLRDMFEYYVPLRGFKDNTAEDMYTYYRKPNSTGYTKPILGAEGRKTEAESPFGWIAAMAGSAIASNVKNEAKLALYYFVSNRPENGIATISKTWFVDSGEVDERGKKIFKPAYPPFSEDLSSDAAKANYEAWQENMRELQKKGQAYEAGQRLNLGNAVVNISDANKPEHIVNVKVGGKDYTIIINGNPRAAQAINGDLNIEGTAQDYSALFGPVLRWMSSVNTSYNPEFWITNMMRDMAFTMMAVNIKEDPAYRRKFKKNYLKAFKVISLVAKNEKGTIGDSYLEQQYKDFVKYGGVTGYTQIKDSETWEQEIENYLSSNDPESVKNGKVMRGMKSAFHAAHRFGESLEQVSRFAAFLTARETGKSINEAIDDAKEITVNFNRKGSGKMITLEEAKYLTGKNGQPLTKPQQWMVVGLSSIAPLGRRFIMFFNAAIQGLNATYKLMKKNPKRFTGWALGYAAVGMMNAVLHAMMDDDDDYLDIPDYERRNSLMIGGNGAYFKWALPQEARAFYALGDLAVEAVMGRTKHKKFLGQTFTGSGVIGDMSRIIAEILPVNPSEGWKAFMPSVAIPFIELALNEDYKGAPIYNEQKWLSEEEKERTAKWSNAYQGTGWTYVKIAQGLNFITGGDKHDAGLINLQPEKLEHLVQSAFGGTIRTADKFINTISAAIDPEEPMTIRQTPFLNRFLTINDERFKNVHVNDVFDYYKADAEHALTLEKQYIKDRDMDSLTELRSSDEYQWAKIYGKYKKPLKAIQDKIKVADGTAEKKELMKQQDELKKRMIKEISEL